MFRAPYQVLHHCILADGAIFGNMSINWPGVAGGQNPSATDASDPFAYESQYTNGAGNNEAANADSTEKAAA